MKLCRDQNALAFEILVTMVARSEIVVAAASKADAAFSRRIRRGGYLHTRMDCRRGATFRPHEHNAAHLKEVEPIISPVVEDDDRWRRLFCSADARHR